MLFRNLFSGPKTPPKRAYLLAGAAVAIGIPAALMAGCADCDEPVNTRSSAPFCALPRDTRQDLERGFREGRSGDIQIVVADEVVSTPTNSRQGPVQWPNVEPQEADLVFWGHAIQSGTLEPGTRFDSVAPTLAKVVDIQRPHPEVRSGRAVGSVSAMGADAPRLVVMIAWKRTDGARSVELEDRLAVGAGTARADPGSLPLDPAALLATVGTGALPYQHGITGTLIRDERGVPIEAFDEGSPSSVVASFGDDLERIHRQGSRVGMIGTTPSDVALIGRDWYLDGDEDDVVILEADRVTVERHLQAASGLLRSGYGGDPMPDLLGFAFTGSATEMDRFLPELERLARRAAGGAVTYALVSVSSTGEAVDAMRTIRRTADVNGVPPSTVAAVGAGAIFLDAARLGEAGISADPLVKALPSDRAPLGHVDVADAFPSTAIAFGRYC